MKTILFVTLISILASNLIAQNEVKVEISTNRLKRDVYFLASDSLEGRKFPDLGRKIAAKYIAQEFEEAGLKKISDNDEGYFQKIPVIKMSNGSVELSVNNVWNKQGYLFAYASKSPTSDSILLPIRYWGENLPLGQNLGDTIVHIFSKSINEGLSEVEKLSGLMGAKNFAISLPTKRAEREIFWQNNSLNSYHYPKSLIRSKSADESIYTKVNGMENEVEVFLFSEKFVEMLYGNNLKNLNRQLKRTPNKNVSAELLAKLNYKLQIDSLQDENVIGYLEGTTLKDEIIIVCGHYDHVGKRGNDIFNGADDNASGTAGVLELARMCAQAQYNGFEFKRSIVFIAFAAEESGLNGSYYYVNNPIFPLENKVIVINMDMIGRPENFSKYPDHVSAWPIKGNKRKVRKTIRTIDKQIKGTHFYTVKKFPQNLMWYFGSDHYPFVQKGVPALVVSTEMHSDYHKPTDTAEKLNYENMANIIKGLFALITELANNPDDFPIRNK